MDHLLSTLRSIRGPHRAASPAQFAEVTRHNAHGRKGFALARGSGRRPVAWTEGAEGAEGAEGQRGRGAEGAEGEEGAEGRAEEIPSRAVPSRRLKSWSCPGALLSVPGRESHAHSARVRRTGMVRPALYLTGNRKRQMCNRGRETLRQAGDRGFDDLEPGRFAGDVVEHGIGSCDGQTRRRRDGGVRQVNGTSTASGSGLTTPMVSAVRSATQQP